MKAALFSGAEPSGRRPWAIIAVLGTLILAGCSSSKPPPPPPPPTKVVLTITAAPDVNPNPLGRPSPIEVRIYELKASTAFDNADYFTLWDKGTQTLGSDLVKVSDLMLSPGEVRSYETQLPDGTNYLALAASYRNIGRADWHAAIPIPQHKTNYVYALLQSRRVWMTLANPPPKQ